MAPDIMWLIGVLFSLSGVIGGIIVRDRQLMRTINNIGQQAAKATNEGDEKLHIRINKVQDQYVRRDDLNGHIQSIENIVNQMREEQRETNRRIDALLVAMNKRI